MNGRWVRSLALDGGLVVLWLTSVGMVVVYERGGLWGGARNPLETLGATLESKEQWSGLYYQGQQIGFAHTMLHPQEGDGIPGVTIIDRGRIAFNLLGTPQELEIGARVFIDADWRLQAFSASLQSANYQLTWTGHREGEDLVVSVKTPGGMVSRRLRDPTGRAFVNGLSSWATFHRLRVGQSGRTWILNPLALRPEAVYFHVKGLEVVEGTPALVVESDVAGVTVTSWVTPEGEVVKETSPLGWELRRDTREAALRYLQQAKGQAPDLLSSTAVPIDRPLDSPEQIERLVFLVEGLQGEGVAIQRPWQRVLPPEQLAASHRAAPQGNWCLVQLDRPPGPEIWARRAGARGEAERSLPAGVARYQRPSLFVQSDDPLIVAKAAEIVGGRSDPWEQVVALNQWVYAALTKQLTIGLPSAVDVLQNPVGDCHEHTILFTALARSRRLPTRMVAGLVYWNGQLYYHAWPEVWLGEWVPTDPTLGQPVADATHLGLSSAENEDLVALGQFVGRLRIQVLEVVRNTVHATP